MVSRATQVALVLIAEISSRKRSTVKVNSSSFSVFKRSDESQQGNSSISHIVVPVAWNNSQSRL